MAFGLPLGSVTGLSIPERQGQGVMAWDSCSLISCGRFAVKIAAVPFTALAYPLAPIDETLTTCQETHVATFKTA